MTEVPSSPDRPFVPARQEDNPILWALQTYQTIIRRWMHDLTAIEFTVLMQIIDRTVGWQKTRYTIGVPHLLEGGRSYSGIGHTVKRSSLMNALRSLEDKGIIERKGSRVHNQYREYVVNTWWQPSEREPSDNEDFIDEGDEMAVASLYDQQQDGSI